MPDRPLQCDEIVVRVLKKPGWYDPDTKLVKADAFLLQSKDQNDGLSVNILSASRLPDLFERWNTCFGGDTLHPGRIRQLGLDVVQREGDDADHAVITGLPFGVDDESRAQAEWFASELAKMARPLDRTTRRKR